ncbi:hypothetical protein ACQ4WX_39270 [Streptomyces lasalocidi]
MPKERFPSVGERAYGAPSSVLRRVSIGGVVLAVLLAVAGLVAYLARTESAAPAQAAPAPVSSSASAAPAETAHAGQAVAAPPRTTDPIEFAKAATKVLWTYDTRTFSQAEHLAAASSGG